MRIIISGGGTGGHVFPAIAVANALKEKGIKDILFVGANGKMEMEKVPQAGYKIEGLDISGFHRKKLSRNITFPFKLIKSLLKAKKIIENFKPDIVIGFGGFASGPILKMAQRRNIPTILQEQNSYPGVTNKLLSKKADKICVAYSGMDKFFDKDKIVLTGNPVRKDLLKIENLREEGIRYFDLNQNKKTILIFGGSLGAQSLNEAVANSADRILALQDVQIIWQVGKLYYNRYKEHMLNTCGHVKILPFIDKMTHAYAAADLIICRAGALTISELALVGKAAILIPSPNVAEDHQTKNAMALVEKGAAHLVKDVDAKIKMLDEALGLLENKEALKSLCFEVRKLARPDAREQIANEVLKIKHD